MTLPAYAATIPVSHVSKKRPLGDGKSRSLVQTWARPWETYRNSCLAARKGQVIRHALEFKTVRR